MGEGLRPGALACLVTISVATLWACSGGDDDGQDRDARPDPDRSEEATAALRGVTVTGPVAAGTRPSAFAAPTVDLEAAGYVAEEFFYKGRAAAYQPAAAGADLDADGRWDLKPGRTAPFKTRMLVIRPSDPEDFSGTVWVEWLNVTAGFDIGDLTPESVRDGDATVYVSAQKVGVDGAPGGERNGLRGWDPKRYGSLSHPGDDFSYDMYATAALLVGPHRGKRDVDPMHGFDVKHVLGNGASQSAMRLTSFLNGVQPLVHALDGALLLANFGRATRFETPDESTTIESTFLGNTRIRDDLGIPVMLVTTETEAETLYPVRQPDTDTFRTWEIAGGSHAGAAGGIDDIVATFTRDGLAVPSNASGSSSGALGIPENPNFLRWLPVVSAARVDLVRWAGGGEAPPSLPLITIEGDPPQIRRDEHGNARGGIRLPELDVPVATYRGTAEGADVMTSLFGSMAPFSAAQIRDLYPSREAYLSAYNRAVDRAVDAGYLLAEDASSIEQAASSSARKLFPERGSA